MNTINLTAFWSAMLGAIPGFLVSLSAIYITMKVNKSVEKLRSDLQRDIVKFSKWHEKRVDASVAIYVAFRKHLNFLRLAFYWPRKGMDVTPMHEFGNAIEENIIYLDDSLAEKVLQYQGELLQFWNDSIYAIGTESVRNKLDYEIPAYLRRLRGDINDSMDPNYRRSETRSASLLHPPAEPPKPYPET